ncbi:MAG: YlbF family regulator [Eubacterium sp.]
MNVYDQAHGLAQAIKESEEFKQYDQMQKLVDSDPELSNMVKELQNLQIRQQSMQMNGDQPTPEMMQEIQRISAMMMSNPAAAQYMQTAMRFSLMMADVYKIVGEAIGMDMSQLPDMMKNL